MANTTQTASPPELPAPTLAPNTETSRPSKRSQRRRKNNQSPYLSQADGTVSDSVTNPLTSPQAKRIPKQRQQSVASAAAPPNLPFANPNPNSAANANKQRPSSHGSQMLPSTPFKEQAYAGPTFQASPAPSSLPVPKFFSRSVPNAGGPSSLAQRMEEERTPDKESSPEPDDISPRRPDRESQKSPLDVFFQADRQERERSRSGSGLSPEMARRQNVPKRQLAGSVFLSDMDGSDGDSTDHTTSLHANGSLQSQRPFSSPGASAGGTPSDSDHEAQTKALKALLFENINNASLQSQASSTPPLRNASNRNAPNQAYETPPPFQRSLSGSSTPTTAAEYQQQQQINNYHYGNQRNLSPLFKAATGRNNQAIPRPSGLRQQELAPDTAAQFAHGSYPTPLHHQQQLPQQRHPPVPPPIIDPNSFSRTSIEQHIPNAGQFANGNAGAYPSHPPPPGASPLNFQRSAPTNGTAPPQTSPDAIRTNGSSNSTAGTRDVQGMEDDLRRMLNLNVLSN